ncbi:MFS transporter [Marinomonas sp. THO17]|uniref:MFS transporter n=1 Tax=Marinomonas sp. THO17 TaxID=3149048 RepID=UPI00336C21D8
MPLTQTPDTVSQTQWLEVILLWLAGVSAAMQFAKFSVSFDALLAYYQQSATLTGMSLSIVGIAGLIFGVSAGMIASRFGYLRVLIGALLLGGALSMVQSILPPFNLLMVTRLLEGFSQLGVVVAAPTLIAKFSAPQHRSLTMGIWGTFFGVAFAVCGGLGKSILEIHGLSALLLSHGILISGIGIILFFILRNNPLLILLPVVGDQGSILAQMIRIYKNPRALLPSLVFLFYTCTLVSILTYVPGLINDKALHKSMLIILPLLSTSGTFLAGAIAQYVMRPQRVALLAYFGVALAAMSLVFVSHSPWLLSFVLGGLVLCLGMIPGASLAMIPYLARNPKEQAEGYGLLAQFGNLGATIGPPSYAALMTLFGLFGIVGLVLLICFFGVLFSLLAARLKAIT